MSLNKTELLLGVYIALYIGIPANGVEEIFGFNVHVIILGFALLSYFINPQKPCSYDNLTWKYVGVQLFFVFAFLFSSLLFSDVNYYGIFMNFAQFITVIFLMGQIINKRNFESFLQFFVYGCVLNSILALGGPYVGLQTIKYTGIDENRITVIGRDCNELAMIHNMSTVIALFFLREKKRIIVNILAILLTIVTILITGSRTGLVACFFLIILNFLISSSIKQRIVLLFSSVLLFGCVYFAATHYLDSSMIERYMNIKEELKEGTMANRTIIWSFIIKAFNMSSPFEQFFGHGWNTTPLFTFNGYDAHNVFLKALIEFGIIGLIVLLIYIFFFVRNAYKRRHTIYSFLIGGIILCLCISFMTLSWIYNIIIWIVFLLIHKVIIYTK